MNYEEALNCIIKKQSLGIKPGLERVSSLLDCMGNPQEKLKIIHIAGTNGKGTVAKTLAKTLENLNLKVGLFTSPWVDDYREQIQVNSKYIDKESFCKYIDKYKDYDATEFELVTAMAYKYFSDCKVDFAVVECGMGGLNDSTNAISSPSLCIITSVCVDHTNFLGNTIEEIAREKAGIIKKNSTVVMYPNPKIRHIFVEKCNQTLSKLIDVADAGDFLKNDMSTVKTALSALGYKNAEVVLQNLPARQEYICENIMLDAAHNTGGAKALLKSLPDKKITAVIGMMQDKNVDGYLKILAPRFEKIIAVKPPNPRAMQAQELAEIAMKYCKNVTVCTDPAEAVKNTGYDFLLVCGSFYLARAVRKELINTKFD